MNLLAFTLGRPERPYHFFELPGEPMGWKRAGRGRYGKTFNASVKDQKDIVWYFKAACPGVLCDSFHNWGVRFRFFFAAKINQRADIDNLEKNILDALNGTVWQNDKKVQEVYKIIAWAPRPRTECLFYRLSNDYLSAWCELK